MAPMQNLDGTMSEEQRQIEALRKELTYQAESHQQTATLYKQQLDALRRQVAVLEQACKMTVAQWDDVCVPGAACEGCPEPDYVAACRAALSASPPAKPDADYRVVGMDVGSVDNFTAVLKLAKTPDPNANKDAAAIRHLQLENDGLRSMLNQVRDVLRDMHDPADLGGKIAAEKADANAAIVQRLKAWHDKRKGTSLHRMAYYPHLIKRYDELEQIIADAAALRAGAGGKSCT